MTSKGADQATEAILIALRRVIRAVELHSRKLVQSHGLTGPQSVILREVIASGGLTPGELARRVSVSQATVTDIVKRLEARKLLRRHPDAADRRRVMVKATRAGERLHAGAPPLLQETFVQRFAALPEWEQNMLLAALQRTAALMDAEDIDASPLLTSGPVDAPPEAFD